MPSLTRLSPSTMVTSLRGTPRRRAIEVAARGSVGETIAPEHERAGPREAVDERVRDDGDADGRRDDEPDREQPDRPHVRAQVAERGEERGAVEERRQDAEEDELRLKLEIGHARDEADREATEHEQDRVGDRAEPVRARASSRPRGSAPSATSPSWELQMHRPTAAACSLDGRRRSARDRPGLVVSTFLVRGSDHRKTR